MEGQPYISDSRECTRDAVREVQRVFNDHLFTVCHLGPSVQEESTRGAVGQ